MRNSNPDSLSLFSACFVGQQAPTFNTLGVSSDRWNRADAVGHAATDSAYSMSMHRHGAVITNAALPVPQQARVDTHDMFVVRLCKGLMRKIDGQVKKGGVFRLAHWAIVGDGSGFLHSYFPRVFAMPTSSLFLPIGSYPNASELFGGLRK